MLVREKEKKEVNINQTNTLTQCCRRRHDNYFVVAVTESARCSGGRVLVHCQAGVSRSATIVVAYLMARYGRPLMDTFQLVKQRRQIVAPNFNFMGQLLEFEQRCRRGELNDVISDRVPPPALTDNTAV